jgi:hypothetical protein
MTSATLVHVDAIILTGCTILLPQLLLIYTVTKLALESTVVHATIAHEWRSRGVGRRLKGILELHPMSIVLDRFFSERGFIIFFWIKIKTNNIWRKRW